MANAYLFNAPTIEQSSRQLATEMPQGRAWGGKFIQTTDTNKLITAMGHSINIVQQQIEHLAKEFNLNLTDDLLPEWEASVRLPDECKRNLTTLAERRNAVITQLQKIPVVTKAEYETLGTALIGQTVVVVDGVTYDTIHNFPDKYSKFKLYIEFINPTTGFPYSFPYPFGGYSSDIVECVFRKITPAMVSIILA